MTLNGVMALILRNFTEFGKPAFQTCVWAWITSVTDNNAF